MRLQDIWEEIGIPEEQRVQRTNEVHKHIKVGLAKVPLSVSVMMSLAPLTSSVLSFSVGLA